MNARNSAPGSVIRLRMFCRCRSVGGPGRMPGNVPALFSDDLGLLVRVERDRRVEVGEADDQQAVQDDVEPVARLHQVLVDEVLQRQAPAVRRQDVGQQDGKVQHRAGEDDRDDAAGVDLHGDVGALAPVHAAAHHPFGERDRDPPLALLDEHDGDQQHERQGHDHGELEVAALGPDGGTAGGHARHHVDEDQDGHALADAALGDQLTEPHHERGAGGHGQHDQQHPADGELRDEVDVVEPLATAEEAAAHRCGRRRPGRSPA